MDPELDVRQSRFVLVPALAGISPTRISVRTQVPSGQMRIGYLATHYPAVSHTFILREIRALRGLGVEIETFSVHRARESELLAEADRQESQRTYTVLPPNWLALLRCHAYAFARAPRKYATTLLFALRRATPGVRGRLWGLFYFAEAMAIWDGARRRKVRHLHAIFADGASDVALLVTHYGGSRWTWSSAIHGPVEFYDVGRNHLAEKLESARFTVAISDFGRSQLMTLAPENRWKDIHVIRCGLDPAEFGEAQSLQTSGEPHILCVGRLVHLKGQSLLIRASAQLLARGIPTRVTLVGDGPKRAELEELATWLGVGARIRFTGSVGQDHIRALYAAADVFCLPSMAEGLPVVLMEAMALAVPVVTTRIMGIPELVEDGHTGLLVSPGNLDHLVEVLARILGDPELRAHLAAHGRTRVLEEFNVNESARQLRRVLTASLSATPDDSSSPSVPPRDAVAARPSLGRPQRGRGRGSGRVPLSRLLSPCRHRSWHRPK